MQSQTKYQQSQHSNRNTDKQKLSRKSSKQERSVSKSKGFRFQKQSKNKSGSKQKNVIYFFSTTGLVSKPKLQSEKHLKFRDQKSRGSMNRNDRNQATISKSKDQKKFKLTPNQDLKRFDQISYCSRATSPENYVKKFQEIYNKKSLNKKHLSPKYAHEVAQTGSPYFPKNDVTGILKNAKSLKKEMKRLITIPNSPKNKRESLWRETSNSNYENLMEKDKQYTICLNAVESMRLKQIQSEIRIQNAQVSGYFIQQESIIIKGMESEIITDLVVLA